MGEFLSWSGRAILCRTRSVLEIVERSFAHNLDRGGMRRTWLRGRENVHNAIWFTSPATISAS
jgi:hypothetical protein